SGRRRSGFSFSSRRRHTRSSRDWSSDVCSSDLPTLCGLATWVLLRILLATLLGRAAKLRAVPWALLIAHLVWYLPYGTTLRPERSEERRVGRGSVSQALSPRRDANQRAAPDATS